MSDQSPVGGATPKQRRRTTRSPQYPAVPLETAVARARQIRLKDGFHPMRWDTAIQDMDLSPTSSTGMRALSALIQYGLVNEEETAAGKPREVRLSDLAKRILLDERPESPERNALLREAALKPAIFKAIRTKYGKELPSDATVKLWLVTDKHYNPDSVGDVIANYKATLAYSDLDSLDETGDIGDTSGAPARDGGGAQERRDEQETPPPAKKSATKDVPLGGGGVSIREERPMPDTGAATEPWDLVLPLPNGKATLRVPTPLTTETLDLLQRFIKMNLDFQKEVLRSQSAGNGG